MTKKIDQGMDERAAGARAVFNTGQRGALLGAFLLLVVLRIPRTWRHGRFLDEEATVFLAYAWHRPWPEALFRPFAGYWNLAANATTLLVAHLVKGGVVALEVAPYLTMTMALAVQVLPAVLILTGRAAWLARRTTVIGTLLILSVTPGIEEVFFNVLHIQFHLALCVALILTLDAPRRTVTRIGYNAVLFLAPLCGPVALTFLPLFALRALVDRNLRRIEQIAALVAAGAIQFLFFYGHSPLRSHMLDPGTIVSAMLVRLIAMPALGFGRAEALGTAIDHSQVAGGSGWLWGVVGTVLFFGSLLIVAARRRDGAIWLLLASLSVAIVSYGFGMILIVHNAAFDLDSERYTFLPLVLLSLGMLVMAMRRGSKGRPIFALILLLTLITGVSRYARPLPGLRDGPSWPNEVAIWRHDHHHPLAVWPTPWRADLSDETRACSPIADDRSTSTDPRYCESGWVAGFYRPQTTTDR